MEHDLVWFTSVQNDRGLPGKRKCIDWLGVYADLISVSKEAFSQYCCLDASAIQKRD